jgi:Ca-activated chloride channel homolog
MLTPLVTALRLLKSGDSARDAVVVLITDGQVGNEDQILRETVPLMSDVRVHTVGIDQAVNAGFLARLAAAGGGRCELVESEDRLDDAMDAIHRRIAAPLVAGLRLSGDGIVDGSISPARLPDVFAGVPLVIRGRYRDAAPVLTLTGRGANGEPWQTAVQPVLTGDPAVTQVWARAAVRDLEDAYAVAPDHDLEQRIVGTSLRFGVLCRFTAFVAVDVRTVTENGALHRVVQPVELPAGWADPLMPELGLMAHAVTASGAPRMVRAAAVASESSGVGAGRPFRASRARGLADAGPGSGADPLASARAMAAAEARRLDAERGSNELHNVLDDLATRLDALVRQLEAFSIDARELRAISELLRDTQLSAVERATRASRALVAFARSDAERRSFWKQS